MISERKQAAALANLKRASEAAIAKTTAIRFAYDANPKRCLQCPKPIPYSQRANKFCGHSCAAAYTNLRRGPRSASSRRKTGDSLLGRHHKTRELRRCRLCWKEFEAITGVQRWYCSARCGRFASAVHLRMMQAANSLAYIESEKSPLAALNTLFVTVFQKERVGGRYFDFADERYLIEHTRDNGKGIATALSRFVAAKADGRMKILYANTKHLGEKRRARFAALDVMIRDYRELE